MTENIKQAPLVYLVTRLGIKMSDYSPLSEEDKNDLKKYAEKEIAFLNSQEND